MINNNKNTAELDTATNAVDARTTIKKDSWGDWVVRLHVDGKFVSDYHTNDRADADKTATAMLKEVNA